jgi:hypothetical protein
MMSRPVNTFGWSIATYIVLMAPHLLALRIPSLKEPPAGWLLLALLFVAPFLSGFIWAWREQSQRFGASALIAAACSICLEVLDLVGEWLGLPTAVGGIAHAPGVVAISFIVFLPLTMIGSATGMTARKYAHA